MQPVFSNLKLCYTCNEPATFTTPSGLYSYCDLHNKCVRCRKVADLLPHRGGWVCSCYFVDQSPKEVSLWAS